MAEKPFSKSKTMMVLTAVVASAIGSTVAVGVLKSVDRHLKSTPASFEAEFLRVCNETSRSLPQMIDQVTRWDAITYVPGNLFYKYTILGDESLPDGEDLKREMEPILVANYSTSPTMRKMREAGVKLTYIYSDEKGQVLASIEVLPSKSK